MTGATVGVMTTTLLAPVIPVTPRRTGDLEADPSSLAVVRRALRSGVRLLADAVDGIARDDPCTRERQRAITRFACAVVHEIQAPAGEHPELDRLLVRVEQALRIFAHDVSAGAPLLAPALFELAELLDARLGGGQARDLRRHVTPGHRVFLVPWLVDHCTPEERDRLLAPAPMRLLHRIGEPRYARRLALVRG